MQSRLALQEPAPAPTAPDVRGVPRAGRDGRADGTGTGTGTGLEEFDPGTVADRLLAEFAGEVDVPTVRRVVRACAADITAVPVPALPELVERCARQRLAALLGRPPGRGAGPPVSAGTAG